jgi:myo-inositol catabolism protein IolH
MKLALDPYMIRDRSFDEMCRITAEAGYQHIEMSPRPDLCPFFVHPRANRQAVQELKTALRHHGVELASILPLYRWAGPDEDARQAAVRYWKRAIEICVELGCDTMNSEFNGRPEASDASEAQLWRSLEELLPVFEREGVALNLEAHPDDFIETNTAGVELVRAINSSNVGYVYCAPHTFHLGTDIGAMIHEASDVLRHVHVADTFDQTASSGLRYILNPPGTQARIHQHLDIGQGEVDFDAMFRALAEVGFDGILTVCVFAWEERAVDSFQTMFEAVNELATRHGLAID